jgi:hypothetical protein
MTDEMKILEKYYNAPKHTNSVAGLWALVKEFGIKKKTVEEFLKQQPDYQTLQARKSERKQATMMRFKPGYIQIDTIDVGNLESEDAKYILTCVDVFTRKLWAYPLKANSSKEVSQQLEKFIKEYKLVTTIQSDNGKEFEGEVPKLLESNNIKSVKSSPGNPTTNAFVERANGTIKRALYGYLQKTGDDPIPHLREFTDSINLVKNETTKVVPDVAVLPKYQEQIIENQKKYAGKKNQNAGKDKPFQPGDKVRILLEKTDLPVNIKQKLKTSKGYLPRWSNEIYTVIKESKPTSEWAVPYVKVESTNAKIAKTNFKRSDLLLIDDTVTKGKTHKPKKQLVKEFEEQDDLDEFLKEAKPRKMKGASGLEEKDLFKFNEATKTAQATSRAERAARRNKT